MKKEVLSIQAPSPIGPYSQGIEINNTVFLSGQVAIIPETGDLVNGSVADEAHQVMKNIGAVLKAAKLDYSHIVKTSIFLKDMADFNAVNEVYSGYFQPPYPARETVQVAKLPKDVKVEISVIAVRF